jgi:radical SAM protein with 4Fe4S-binding SPASM domain
MIIEKIDNITRISPEYRNTILPAPKSVKIELTGKCNFACTFCARSDVLREQQEMDKDLFFRLVKEMREAGVEELGLFYLGESFMVKWLPEAIQYAKAIGYPYVFLTTNGSLVFPDRAEACMKAGLDSLKFSYNYADGKQLRDIARVKERFFQTIQNNIKDTYRIRETGGYSCGLYASYIEYDGEQGLRMQEAVKEIEAYVDEVYALPLYNQANLVTDREEKRGWKPVAGNRGRVEALRDPLPCWAVFTEGHITSDGKLSACCFDHDGRFHMGDLTTTPFMEAWNSQIFQDLRAAHLKEDVTGTACEKCVAYQ